jgi:hypothetical protein
MTKTVSLPVKLFKRFLRARTPSVNDRLQRLDALASTGSASALTGSASGAGPLAEPVEATGAAPHGLPALWARLGPGGRNPQEAAELAAAKAATTAEEKRRDELRALAAQLEKTIIETLTRHGICRVRKLEKVERIDEVRIRRVIVSGELAKFKIDTRRLPGVSLEQLEDPNILRLLTINCTRMVSTHYDEKAGFWYVVELHTGAQGLPVHVSMAEFWIRRPAHLAAARYAIPLGVARGKKDLWLDFSKNPNMLVSGSPGWGKSVFMNGLICTWLRNNRPGQIKFAFIDLKGGIEFAAYKDLPHVLNVPRLKAYKSKEAPTPEDPTQENTPGEEETEDQLLNLAPEPVEEDNDVAPDETQTPTGSDRQPAFVEQAEYVPALMRYLIGEIERRAVLFKRAGVKDLGHYNQRAYIHYLPPIILFVDEWAAVFTYGKVGKVAQALLQDIANRGRAVGVWIITATQTPNKEIFNTALTNSFNLRMVFRVANKYVSNVLINSFKAADISAKGRAYFSTGGNQNTEVQFPFIHESVIGVTIAAALLGQAAPATEAPTATWEPIDVWRVALEKWEGNLRVQDVWREFQERGMKEREARAVISEHVGKQIPVDGTLYHLWPPKPMPAPRPARLLPVAGDTTDGGPDGTVADGKPQWETGRG